MRERAQASVETVALLAAALALAAALLLGVAKLGPPLAASIGEALSSAFSQGTPKAPGLDPLERLLLDGATSADADGPTLLDVQTEVRARLGHAAGDAAFKAMLRPLLVRALAAYASTAPPGRFVVVDRATEDAWVRDRFHPGLLGRIGTAVAGVAGGPGAVVSLINDSGLTAGEPDGIEPGHAAGDVLVQVGAGLREVTVRRVPGSGLEVIRDGLQVDAGTGTP
jgi:hypothetical protein